MNIKLDNIGKRYRYEWIFRNIDFHFETGKAYAISGANGAGKSTFMQLLSGHLSPSKGVICYSNHQRDIEIGQLYQYLSFAAPYVELVEELTLSEMIDFHLQFKSLLCSKEALLDLLQFTKATRSKAVKYFSSGMQQRLKLALAICSDTALLLLDEPTVTLDAQAIDWFGTILQKYAYNKRRTIVIASNISTDFVKNSIAFDIGAYKKKPSS